MNTFILHIPFKLSFYYGPTPFITFLRIELPMWSENSPADLVAEPGPGSNDDDFSDLKRPPIDRDRQAREELTGSKNDGSEHIAHPHDDGFGDLKHPPIDEVREARGEICLEGC